MFSRGRAVFAALAVGLAGVAFVAPAPPVGAATLPPGFSLVPTASGQGEFNLTDFAFLPAGGMLTTGKNGRVTHVAANGAVAVVAQLGVFDGGDLGLVGLAVGADYSDTGYVYAVYSHDQGGTVYDRLVRWTVDNPATPRAIVNEFVVIDGMEHYENVHGVGQVLVDTDGTIWFAMGDASPWSVPSELALGAQDLNKPQGKLFHINPNGSGVPDNPFYNKNDPLSWTSRIYAYGFRNPFRFSLHADGTPYVGDVGWNTREEVDVVRKGGNYGWPCWEGTTKPNGYNGMATCQAIYAAGTTQPPLWEIARREGYTGSITGGTFALGDAYPEPYRNSWFFGDYSLGRVWTLETGAAHELVRGPESSTQPGTEGAFVSEAGGPVAFRLAPNGEVHYADIYTGNVNAIRYTAGNRLPTPHARAEVTYGNRTVRLFGSSSTDPDGDPLSYEWDFGDGSPHAFVADPVHDYPAVDTYTARLTVRDGKGGAASEDVTVAIDDHEPVLAMTAPPDEKRFQVGEPLTLTAAASDAEDIDMGPEDITWRADLIHCSGGSATACHTHPGRTSSGAQFSMPYPDHGGDTHLKVTARVEDSVGHVVTSSYTARPQLQTLTLTSQVGARLLVNGEWVGPDNAVSLVAGSHNLLSATSVNRHIFDDWSDTVDTPDRAFTMPAVDFALEARYRPAWLDLALAPTANDHTVELSISPVGNASDRYSSLSVEGCTTRPGRGDNGDGVLAVGETWTLPCRVAAGSYPGTFVARATARGVNDAVIGGEGSIALRPGYRMVATDGGIFSFGTGTFYGSTGGMPLNAPIVGMASAGEGYWLVASDGGIFTFGTAQFLGSKGGQPLNKPIVGMAATPSGNGYWLVASDGGIFTFGDAQFYGSMGGTPLNKPIVGMAATPSGNGYWLVASDGGIFTFGDAPFLGSTGGTVLNRPVLGMASTPSGHGYWLVASDGGIFTFGDAPFLGSMGGTPLNQPVVGMASTPSGQGYWMVASDGGVFTFGDGAFLGSMGGTPLNRPIVGMTPSLAP